jgi:hypothetical protein
MAFSQSIAPALKRRTADGAEAPYSGASRTMRQSAASQQPTFGDCTRLSVLTVLTPANQVNEVRSAGRPMNYSG